MYHLSCGKKYIVKPYRFNHNRTRYPHCFRKIRKTTKQFKEKSCELVGDQFKVLGEYQDTDKKIEMPHASHENVHKNTFTYPSTKDIFLYKICFFT